jgi:hypothetical protein
MYLKDRKFHITSAQEKEKKIRYFLSWRGLKTFDGHVVCGMLHLERPIRPLPFLITFQRKPPDEREISDENYKKRLYEDGFNVISFVCYKMSLIYFLIYILKFKTQFLNSNG